jgi:hypothetical protein
MDEAVDLQHGLIYSVGAGPVDVAVMHLSNPVLDGQPQSVVLMVATADGEEHDFTLRVGDRFPAGPETWQVRSIDDPGDYDYTVRIERVAGQRGEVPQPPGVVVASPERQEELRRQWEFSSRDWTESRDRVNEAEQRRARELFGDRQPFAIPDEETDA